METKVYKTTIANPVILAAAKAMGVTETPVTVVYGDDGKCSVSRECKECGTTERVELENSERVRLFFEKPEGRPYADELFPELSKGQVEMFFVSGICERCWDEMFTEPDDV